MSTNDPFGFMAAINWDAVDEHAEEIAAIFDKGEAQAEDEQEHWENDPEYMALYVPPSDLPDPY